MIWDEDRFWRTTLLFSKVGFRDPNLLKDYGQLSAPFAFMILGALEHFFGDGLFAGRLFNLTVSSLV